jgi:hypothetical protein
MDIYGHLLPGSFAKLVNVLDTPTSCNPDATGIETVDPITR